MVSKKLPISLAFFICALFFGGLNPSLVLAQTGWYQVEKVSLEFSELVRIELQGTIVEASDPSLKSLAIPFVQSLHYLSSISRPTHRAFPNIAEIRTWASNEICKEEHDLTLKPIRENGAIGSVPLKGRVKPSSVSITGTRIETKGSPISEIVYCKPNPR